MRRVLFVTSNYPRWPGDSTTPFVHHLARDLRALGWRVTVLAPHAPGAALRETMDDVEVRRFRYLLPERAQTICYGGGALVNLREAPVNKVKLPALVAAEWLATARELARGFDVVHAHWTLPQGFVVASIPWRLPRVLTVHGGDVFGLRGRAVDRFSAFALRRADRVTVASAATELAVRDIAGARVDVARVPMGIDVNASPRAELVARVRRRFRGEGGPLLMFVGRLVEEKGIFDVVDVIERLVADLPGVSAALVGTGQHADRLRMHVRERGLADRIHLPGWVEPEDVPSWLAAADLALAPSRIGPDGWTEGQGLAIVEAMAAGTPVIATRTGGIPDTVADGVNGLLVPPADPAALADAVRTLVNDPQAAARLAQQARASVHDRFDRSVSAAAISSIYDSLMTQRGPK